MPLRIEVFDIRVILINREVIGCGSLQRDLAPEELREGRVGITRIAGHRRAVGQPDANRW
jgi:hypothetical protein